MVRICLGGEKCTVDHQDFLGGGTPYEGVNPITPGTVDLKLPAHTLLLNELIVRGDPDLIASNIRQGKDIFGVIGTMQAGNCSMATGEVTPTYGTKSLTITHGLGKNLKYFMIWEKLSYENKCLLMLCWGQSSPYLNPIAAVRADSDLYNHMDLDLGCSVTNGANSIKVVANFDDNAYAWTAIA